MNKSTLLLIAVALGLATGCGGKKDGPAAASAAGGNEDKTIRFIMSDAAPKLAQLVLP